MARARLGDGDPVPAVIDTLAPHSARVAPDSDAPRRIRDIELWSGGSGADAVARARFGGALVFDYHPCAGTGVPCRVGVGGEATPFEIVLGTDLWAELALRFDFPADELRFFPDIPLRDAEHAEMCTAVFREPFAGGGTLVIGGSEEGFEGRRAAVSACMNYDASAGPADRGANALLIVSTGTGVSVLGESAYRRYRSRAAGAPPAAELPRETVHLSSGPVSARMGEIESLRIASEESDERGPCEEVHAHWAVARDACRSGEIAPCPCPGGEDACRTGAVADLGGPLRVAVIADDHELLQSLRSELVPALPDVDGILGADALADLRLELDYPNSRMLASCPDGVDDCGVYPAFASADAASDLAHCPVPR